MAALAPPHPAGAAAELSTGATPPDGGGVSRRVWLVAVTVALAILASTGCGKAKAPNVATAQQLAARIAEKGVGCQDFAASTVASDAGSTSASSGACTVAGQRLALAVYQSAGERDKGQVELLKGCIGRRALNPNSTGSYSFAKGPTWIVLSPDHTAVTAASKVLHASVQKSPC